MPKKKFCITKKHEKLIDITTNTPELSYIQSVKYEMLTIDYRTNTENNLLWALEVLSKGTQYENTCNELIKRASEIFEYYDQKQSEGKI